MDCLKTREIVRHYEEITGQEIQSIHVIRRQYVKNILDLTLGNQTHAAYLLGVSLRTMRNYVRELKFLETNPQYCGHCKRLHLYPEEIKGMGESTSVHETNGGVGHEDSSLLPRDKKS